MAYRFKLSHPLDDEFRRICGELIGLARRHLTETTDRHTGVHEARRAFKKLRGLLRLARPALGDTYAAENARWRDAARQLSSIRDATALIETFDDLHGRYAPVLRPDALAGVRERLVARRDHLAARETGLEARIAAVVRELDRGRAVAEALALPPGDPAPFAAGIARVYAQARRRYHRACRDMTDEGLHDLRKRAKYHWMHLQLLRDIWPVPVKARMKRAKALSDLLGDDHDLVVFRRVIEGASGHYCRGVEESLLLTVVVGRQAALRDAALAEGRRLFARRPEWFADRIHLVWRATMDHPRPAGDVDPALAGLMAAE